MVSFWPRPQPNFFLSTTNTTGYGWTNDWGETTASYSNYGPPVIIGQVPLEVEPGKAAQARRKMKAWLQARKPDDYKTQAPALPRVLARDPLREHRARSFRRTPRVQGKGQGPFLSP